MIDYQAGGALRADAGKLGLKDRNNYWIDQRGYVLHLRCEAREDGDEEAKEVTQLQKNKWYLFLPKEDLKFSARKVTYLLSPTSELVSAGLTRHAMLVTNPEDVSIYFRPNGNMSMSDIQFHVQLLAIEGVE